MKRIVYSLLSLLALGLLFWLLPSTHAATRHLVITGISPEYVATKESIITIYGRNFPADTGDMKVIFGNVPAVILSHSADSITVSYPETGEQSLLSGQVKIGVIVHTDTTYSPEYIYFLKNMATTSSDSLNNSTLQLPQSHDADLPTTSAMKRRKDSIELMKELEVIRINNEMISNSLPPLIQPSSNSLPPLIQPSEKSAVLGYSYFKNMRQNETRNITAYVKIIHDSSVVISRLQELAAEDIPVRESDTISIFTKNILLYKFLSIGLINGGDSDFIIKTLHVNSKQKVDSAKGNLWTWAITPKTNKPYARLILAVSAEDEAGNTDPFETRNIPINITLDRSIVRKLWDWAMINPEKALTIVIIPFLVFFWKQVTGIFKKEDTKRKRVNDKRDVT